MPHNATLVIIYLQHTLTTSPHRTPSSLPSPPRASHMHSTMQYSRKCSDCGMPPHLPTSSRLQHGHSSPTSTLQSSTSSKRYNRQNMATQWWRLVLQSKMRCISSGWRGCDTERPSTCNRYRGVSIVHGACMQDAYRYAMCMDRM